MPLACADVPWLGVILSQADAGAPPGLPCTASNIITDTTAMSNMLFFVPVGSNLEWKTESKILVATKIL